MEMSQNRSVDHKERDMDMTQAFLTLQHGHKVARVDATRLRFSAHQCFARDAGADDLRCLRLLANDLAHRPGLAVYLQDGQFFEYLLRHVPTLRGQLRCVITEDGRAASGCVLEGIPVTTPAELPPEVATVFLGETLAYPRMR